MRIFTRTEWDGTLRELAELFALKKGNNRRARAVIVTHPLGLELRLTINGDLVRSQVFRDDGALLDEGDQWKAAMTEKGWG
jgi:hypothetical protein